MENYRLIANESYDMIGEEIDLQMKLNSTTREIRFVKTDGTQLMYDAYALQGRDIPIVDSSDFIDSAPRKELSVILNSELLKVGLLPQEVRVIRPSDRRDTWGVFFRQ